MACWNFAYVLALPVTMCHTYTRLVVLESGLGFESGLKSIFAGLGLGLEL